ncbi:MAG TPA: farnesyl diphosphate synthase [Terriglobales bacterium]|nr:farnesyl diphosphate synthase [Terriglobales bacterium]
MDSRAAAEWMEAERAELERRLAQAVPGELEPPPSLHRALRYSLLDGGKRLRPLLCRAAALAVAGQPVEAAWAPACAVEMVHTYSLIHDDLPALDNDDLRRGRPTCHKQFGEALAILAGDALLTLAFGQLAAAGSAAAAMVALLAEAAGTPAGMVAGQVADLEAERAATSAAAVAFIHRRKTAALLRASVLLGGLAAAASAAQLAALAQFGESLGLAFQIVDDLLDLTASSRELGKTAGKDEVQRKATYPAVAGRAAAEWEARRLQQQALDALAPWGPAADRLRALAAQMAARRA